jgi:two-component system nitrogen regulation sensor histidine kinase GlnL
VEKNYEPNLPLVALDESLCEQAFVNIVQNAYDAMSVEGGGVLRVKASKAQRNAQSGGTTEGVEVRIADSGPGIPPELREQIFNPFVTTKKTGVGLGLSIVSKIIDGHRGSIRIEDSSQAAGNGQQNRGACFVIFIPAASHTTADAQNTHLVIS